jgi:Putative lumazine-binding
MKKFKIVTVFVFLFFGLTISAQTEKDSLAIEKACRDYVEGWKEGNLVRISNGVSAELVKRTIRKDNEGLSFISNMDATLLKNFAKRNINGVKAKDFEPNKEFNLDVTIYDITGDYALAKTVNTKYGFFDYCQLAKFNGEWKIINVLWSWIPASN